MQRKVKEAVMTEYAVKRPTKAPPAHPGELMREILDDHVRLSVADAAQRMKISRQSLYAVLRGERLTAEMAMRFGRLVKGDPALFLRMQVNYDLWHAQHSLARTLKKIEPVATAA
jgi:addiction module HigA family antidote